MSRDTKSSSGLSVKTLLIAGAASAAATVIVPLLWRPGTLIAAAMTPIIVALVSEAINRPVEKVSAVTAKKTSRYTAARAPVPDREETFDPLAPPTADELARLNQDLGAAPPPPPRRRDERHLGLTGKQWRLGLVTGLVAFVAAAAVVTASELAIFGDSVAGGRDRTSLFGGSSNKSDDASSTDEEQQDEQRQQDEDATPTPTPTETPEEETSPTPTATPTATPVPGQEAVPQETPAPSTQTAPTPTATPAP